MFVDPEPKVRVLILYYCETRLKGLVEEKKGELLYGCGGVGTEEIKFLNPASRSG